jgi:hypothetical protein
MRNRLISLQATNKEIQNQSVDAQVLANEVLIAPPWIAPQLRAQHHVEARRQIVPPIRGHAAKDRLAVRRDAAARRQWHAADGAGAAKVLDLLWRPARRPAVKRASKAVQRLAGRG